MKQPQAKMLPCYLIGLLVMAASAWLVSALLPMIPDLSNADWPAQLLPAAGLMLAAVAAHLLARKKINWAYLFSYFANAVASGWAIGVLMGAKQILPTIELLLALLPAALLGVFAALLFGLPDTKRTALVSTIFVILAVLLFLSGIAVWVWLAPLTGCVFVFSALFLLPFPLGIGGAMDQPQGTYRCLSFTGFGAFFLILFVVIVILSEGDFLDGLDFDFGGGSGSSKKKKRIK